MYGSPGRKGVHAAAQQLTTHCRPRRTAAFARQTPLLRRVKHCTTKDRPNTRYISSVTHARRYLAIHTQHTHMHTPWHPCTVDVSQALAVPGGSSNAATDQLPAARRQQQQASAAPACMRGCDRRPSLLVYTSVVATSRTCIRITSPRVLKQRADPCLAGAGYRPSLQTIEKSRPVGCGCTQHGAARRQPCTETKT